MKIKVFWIGFSSIFVIMGLVISYFGFQEMRMANASEQWKKATGMIQMSKVESSHDSDSGTSYHAEVLYEFELDGAKIQGNRVSFGELSSGKASGASRIVNRYPKDAKVTIYYNPEDPFEAVLEPGIQGGTWFLPAFGMIFAGMGAFFVTIGFFVVK